jgi:hypothetical protein
MNLMKTQEDLKLFLLVKGINFDSSLKLKKSQDSTQRNFCDNNPWVLSTQTAVIAATVGRPSEHARHYPVSV